MSAMANDLAGGERLVGDRTVHWRLQVTSPSQRLNSAAAAADDDDDGWSDSALLELRRTPRCIDVDDYYVWRVAAMIDEFRETTRWWTRVKTGLSEWVGILKGNKWVGTLKEGAKLVGGYFQRDWVSTRKGTEWEDTLKEGSN